MKLLMLTFFSTSKTNTVICICNNEQPYTPDMATTARPNPANHTAQFLKHTAQQFKIDLQKSNAVLLQQFKVNAKDRNYQFWERNSLSVELRSSQVFNQKLEYIHYNSVKAGLCILPEEYYYSSAKFYATGVDDFGMLTHADG